MSLRQEMVALLPSLRAFAISLCGDATRADDLVQEALVKALANTEKYRDGTNLRAWLFTILRNTYFSELRKRRPEVEDVDGVLSGRLSAPAEQPGKLALGDMREALKTLPEDQREAVLLIGAAGFSYEEAAGITGAAIGTVKSRVNRGRARLSALLAPAPGEGAAEPAQDADERLARTVAANIA